jgi:hypothetical protein
MRRASSSRLHKPWRRRFNVGLKHVRSHSFHYPQPSPKYDPDGDVLLGRHLERVASQPVDLDTDDNVGSFVLAFWATAGITLRRDTQLRVADPARRARSRNRKRRGEHVACNNEGLQRSVHLVLQSRVDRAGGPLLMSTPHSSLAAQPTSSL